MKLSKIFLSSVDKKTPFISYFVNVVIIAFSLILLFYFSASRLNYNFDWSSIYEYRSKFIQGFVTTVYISICALFLSIFFGLLLSFGQKSKVLFLRYLSRIIVETIRGTPLLVQILIFFYLIYNAIGLDNRFIAGVLIISLFSASYLSEVFRGGFEGVGASQLESAKAIGLTTQQTYIHVIFPQAFKRVLPALAGQLASLIKDSSLLSIISIREFTMNAQEVNAFTYSTLESYIPLAIGYFILTFPMSMIARKLENNFHYDY